MDVLVTGSEGFIGTHVLRHLRNKKHNVVGYDLKSGKDVRDLKQLERDMQGIDGIIHLAAQVSVPESVENPHETITTNVQGTVNVFQAALSSGVENIVFVSSAAVYGAISAIGKRSNNERSELISPYAQSKLDGEILAELYREKGSNIAVFRPFNVYGPNQEISKYPAVIPAFINKALRDGDIVIYGDGGQTRDFIFVDDVAEILVNSLHRCQYHSGFSPFDLATGNSITIKDLASLIKEQMHTCSKITYDYARSGDIYESKSDIAKNSALGIRPSTKLEDGLKKTIMWYEELKNIQNNK